MKWNILISWPDITPLSFSPCPVVQLLDGKHNQQKWDKKWCDSLCCLATMLLGQGTNTSREQAEFFFFCPHIQNVLSGAVFKNWQMRFQLVVIIAWVSRNNCLIADDYPFCNGQSLFILFAVMFYKYQRGHRGGVTDRSPVPPGCAKLASLRQSRWLIL